MSATLVIFKKNGAKMDIPLKSGVTIIGRRPDCDVRVPLGVVSRKHCRIVKRDDDFVLQDLGSANGTFLNSQRVMEEVIKAGDIVSVGACHFTVQIDGRPENIEPPQARRRPDAAEDQGPHGSTIKQFPGMGRDQDVADQRALSDSDPLADLEPLADFEELEDSSQLP